MKNDLFYPAIFSKSDEGGFRIVFPDFPECSTEGDDISSAYEAAVNALALAATGRSSDASRLPVPSAPADIQLDKDEILMIVQLNLLAYKRRMKTRAVKKTLSIPEWMNDDALSLGINFSQVLQDALIKEIEARF